MQTQSQSQHARPEAHVAVNPVGWTAVVVQSGQMGTYPDSNIRRHIEVSRLRIWLVLIDRRGPVMEMPLRIRPRRIAHSASDSSAPGDGASWLRARPAVPATCS